MSDDAFDVNRSMIPAAGGVQPFFWNDAIVEPVVRQLRARIAGLALGSLPPESIRSLKDWFRMEHVFESNAIEGSTLTLYETRVVVADGLTVGGKPLRDVLAAKNLAEALDWAEEIASGVEPVGEPLVRQLHALITRGDPAALPGEYKRGENFVRGARHVPTLPVHVPDAMGLLGAFLASTTHDPIVHSAIVHAWLVGIHPFADGNGRTTRLLANLLLTRRHSLFALLRNDERATYYEVLDHAHGTGDLTRFIELWASCVEVVVAQFERLGPALTVREDAIQHAVTQLSEAKRVSVRQILLWNNAIRMLRDALQAMAEDTAARLGSPNWLLFGFERELTEPDLEQARHGSVRVLEISGQLNGRPVGGSISFQSVPERPGEFQLTGWPFRASGGNVRDVRLAGAQFELVPQPDQSPRHWSAQEAASQLFRQFIDSRTP